VATAEEQLGVIRLHPEPTNMAAHFAQSAEDRPILIGGHNFRSLDRRMRFG
jgi:hypothetical protein